MEKRSQFVTVPDLCTRWLYTPRGVQKLVKQAAFPHHFCTVSNGRVRVWILGDIIDWEKEHPEVYDEGAKLRKQKGFFRAKIKGRATTEVKHDRPENQQGAAASQSL